MNKIKKEVSTFNSICGEDKDVKYFLTPTSEVYDQLECRKLTEKQQQAVQAKSLRDHARDESLLINSEIKQYLQQLSFQSAEVLQQIDCVSALEISRKNLGKLHYFHRKHYSIENMFMSCCHLFVLTR